MGAIYLCLYVPVWGCTESLDTFGWKSNTYVHSGCITPYGVLIDYDKMYVFQQTLICNVLWGYGLCEHETETEMPSWRYFRYMLYWKLPFKKIPLQSFTKMFCKWQHAPFRGLSPCLPLSKWWQDLYIFISICVSAYSSVKNLLLKARPIRNITVKYYYH